MIRRRHAIALALAAWVGGGAPAAQAQSLGLAGGEVLRGRFTQQRFLQGFNAPLTSSGSFIVAPGRGIVWRGETPFAIVTVMGPGGLVQRVCRRRHDALPGVPPAGDRPALRDLRRER